MVDTDSHLSSLTCHDTPVQSVVAIENVRILFNVSGWDVHKKPPLKAVFCVRKMILASQPAFDFFRSVLGFPFLKQLVIAALGFDDLAIVRVLVLLHLTGAARGLFCR